MFMMTMPPTSSEMEAMAMVTKKKLPLMSFQREEGIAGFDGEVVFFAVVEMTAAAHDLANFVDAVLNSGG